MTDIFAPRQTRNKVQAALAILVLIYHVAVNNLRQKDRNAVIGLLLEAVQSILMVASFVVMSHLFGVRRSPIRADFILFMIIGVLVFMTNARAAGAVGGSANSASGIYKHEPMTTAVVIGAAALASLYRSIFSAMVLLGGYHLFMNPLSIEDPIACVEVFLLAWFNGCAIGLIMLSIRPWSPKVSQFLIMFYQRINMIASGKMLAANNAPSFILPFFIWNPLFHMIDQMRGFAFINYSPYRTSLHYPLYVTLALLVIGMMLEFVTRRSVSASWTAGK